jgi:hypothetical protein
VKTIQNRTDDLRETRADWHAVATVTMLIGVNLICSGLLQAVPTLSAIAAILPVEPILTAQQTLAVGLGLLAVGGTFLLRTAINLPGAKNDRALSTRRRIVH